MDKNANLQTWQSGIFDLCSVPDKLMCHSPEPVPAEGFRDLSLLSSVTDNAQVRPLQPEKDPCAQRPEAEFTSLSILQLMAKNNPKSKKLILRLVPS